MKVSLNRLPAPAEAGVHGNVGLITTQAGSWSDHYLAQYHAAI